MSSTPALPTNVVRFRVPSSRHSPRRDQHVFLDAVYAARSLVVAAQDSATKRIATRLTILGFVSIEEVQPDGGLRPLRPSEAFATSTDRAWRVMRRVPAAASA